MARYAREDLDRIRDAIDFASLVEQRVELRRAGVNRMTGLCPFHDERTPSFSVNVDEKLFHCFGCGEGGDIFRYIELTEGVDFPDAVTLLADRAGIELKTEEEDPQTAARRKRERRLLELLDRTNRFFERQLWDAQEAQPARDELRRRGLDPEVLRAFRVGYAPSAWDRVMVGSRHAGYQPDEMLAAGIVQRSRDNPDRLYDRFRRRITFPLADRRGRIMGFGARAIGADQKPKYVNSSDGPVYHKGRHLFAAHMARTHAARSGEVILCEGYTDVIALHQAGLENAVGLMGTALTPDQVAALGKLAPSVVLALDADRAGREAMLRAAQLARGSGLNLRVVLLPDGMDPADLLVKRGSDALKAAFASPISMGRFHVGHVLDQADLSTAEGKDLAIDALRPVFAEVPPGVLRMELIAEAAGRLRLDPSVMGSLIDHAATRAPVRSPTAPAAGGPGPRDQRTPGPPSGSNDRSGAPASGRRPAGFVPRASPSFLPHVGGGDAIARAELAFLAECRAAGPEAAPLLADERLRGLIANPVHRQVAALIRDALLAGSDPQPIDDSTRMVLELVAGSAGMIHHPSVAAAELAGLRLELGVVTAMIQAGPGANPGAPPEALQRRKLDLQERLNRGLGELLKGPRRSG
ncbi:MAG: DNA primase [Patulibacter sp.]|nr:DNA primase [Patulibacter sp.]